MTLAGGTATALVAFAAGAKLLTPGWTLLVKLTEEDETPVYFPAFLLAYKMQQSIVSVADASKPVMALRLRVRQRRHPVGSRLASRKCVHMEACTLSPSTLDK